MGPVWLYLLFAAYVLLVLLVPAIGLAWFQRRPVLATATAMPAAEGELLAA